MRISVTAGASGSVSAQPRIPRTWSGSGAPPSDLGFAGDQYERTNGDYYRKTSAGWGTALFNRTGPAGEDASGDVVGPASAANNRVAVFDNSPTLLKDGGKTLPSGTIVGTTDVQVLSNKSLAADGTSDMHPVPLRQLRAAGPLVPQSYGAVADGMSDAAVGIRLMVTAALASGRKMLIPEGTYLLDSQSASRVFNFTTTDGVYDIEGAGRGLTRLVLGDDLNSTILVLRNAARFRLAGMTIECNKDNQSAGSFSEIKNCENLCLEDLEILNPFGNGIFLEGYNRWVTIDNIRVVGARTHTGSSNPSSGHGIALSADIDNLYTQDYFISNIDTLDCDGSGVNVSHAERGVISNIRSVVESFDHNTGYAALRFSNGARNAVFKGITSKGNSRALMISESYDIIGSGVNGEDNWSQGVLVENAGAPTDRMRVNIGDINILNSGRSGVLGDSDAVRLSLCAGVIIGQVTAECTSGAMQYAVRETDGTDNIITAQPTAVGMTGDVSLTSMVDFWKTIRYENTGSNDCYWLAKSGTTGVEFKPFGADANISASFFAKGTSQALFGNAGGTHLAIGNSTASIVNYNQFTGSASGSPVSINAVGSDTNIGQDFRTKGTGTGRLRSGAGTVQFNWSDTGVGFYSTSPVAKPTGVAVTAEGIHTALVTLGLISA